MKSHLRNITITLEDDIARWARIEAATHDTSVSRFLADILKERMLERGHYEAAKRRALARKPFLKTNGRYLTREEVHDRARLR
jgi:plasmid stability protein